MAITFCDCDSAAEIAENFNRCSNAVDAANEAIEEIHHHEPIYVCIQTIDSDEEVIDSVRMYVDKGWSLDDDTADNGYSLLADLKLNSLQIMLSADVQVWIANASNDDSVEYALGTPITEDSILYVYEADNSVSDDSGK